MSTLIDSAAYSANEVYAIQQTDSVEGVGVGASFGGIGVSNQPHQQLANRTAFLKAQQDTNVANIGILQAFTALFSGSMSTNGYVAVPFQDASRGQIAMVVQWGFYSFAGLAGGDVENASFGVTLPTPFPNANEWAIGCYASNSTAKLGALISSAMMLEPVTPQQELTHVLLGLERDGQRKRCERGQDRAYGILLAGAGILGGQIHAKIWMAADGRGIGMGTVVTDRKQGGSTISTDSRL